MLKPQEVGNCNEPFCADARPPVQQFGRCYETIKIELPITGPMATFPTIESAQYHPSRNVRIVRRITQAVRRPDHRLLDQQSFIRILRLEHKRTARSTTSFMFMVVDVRDLPMRTAALDSTIETIASSTRETDTVGWYEHAAKLGVVFTEIADDAADPINSILERISSLLQQKAGAEDFKKLNISMQVIRHPSPDSPTPKSEFVFHSGFSGRSSIADAEPVWEQSGV